MNARKLNNVNV